MCKCNPTIRTPYCGKGECKSKPNPKQGVRASEAVIRHGNLADDIREAVKELEQLMNEAHKRKLTVNFNIPLVDGKFVATTSIKLVTTEEL